MKVRIWIKGADGPSHDFELLLAPRIGERVNVAVGRTLEEGVVESVNWQLQAIDPYSEGLALEGEPAGSVTLVHVICRPTGEVVRVDFEGAVAELRAETLQGAEGVGGAASD